MGAVGFYADLEAVFLWDGQEFSFFPFSLIEGVFSVIGGIFSLMFSKNSVITTPFCLFHKDSVFFIKNAIIPHLFQMKKAWHIAKLLSSILHINTKFSSDVCFALLFPVLFN
ncbi:hypothetical protein AWM68_06910 [Fictibacillus phosphorivorans]|uniref:Uncharacterized protein n=1 Tax=Fictibacillus phosphorivorans TaxID=1221500 RepID=A0A165NHP3_9BACL|nr:hypothetical protein AWM68_06910 [Fictibacillus phosphorivorans]